MFRVVEYFAKSIKILRGDSILLPPRFQHSGGNRPPRPRGSDAYERNRENSIGRNTD